MPLCLICTVGVGDKKPKRRRSSFLSSSSELSPTSKSTAAVSGAPRLTERQQLALLLQMTAEKRGLSAVDFTVFHIMDS